MKKYGCLPRDLQPHIKELQQLLLKDDCFIPSILNTDEGDLAKASKITASSFKTGYAPESLINGVSRPTDDGENAWYSDGISVSGEWLCFDLKEKKAVSEVQLTFDSGFAYPIKITMSDNRKKMQRIGVPPELVSDFTVELISDGKTVLTQSVNGNIQRMCRARLTPTECDRIKITFKSTHGCDEIRVFEVRIG
ncbi:MAG: discoidin domain-containing protein [Clostridia bacterium]|nr:discoidin domain-containing protein [Clostridia bacterium]